MNAMSAAKTSAICTENSVVVTWSCGSRSTLPNLWLRDNCGCNDCRISQTTEKRFFIADVPVDLIPSEVDIFDDTLHIAWPDGHRTTYAGEALRSGEARLGPMPGPWPKNYEPDRFTYRAFLGDDQVATAAISKFVENGVLILQAAPTTPGSLEELVPRFGPIREVLFARIHDVQVDPAGYNVAHTALPLPPHNDFASYTWPPSVQALHMLANETPGGESIVVDGWAVLRALREERPEFFEVLRTTAVPFREFDDENETFAIAPIVRCDTEGRIDGLRFSNQLMQAIDPNDPAAGRFYRAYHDLCRRVSDPRYRRIFRLGGGEILVVAAHRVLHGRQAFEANGRRHLQDAYFELDNVRNHLHVLRRKGVV